MTAPETREAYERRADDYIALFPSVAATDPVDREVIQSWASAQDGPILDVGCGPGHWTGWLRDQGLDIAGIDPVPAFIERARRMYPDVRFDIGSAESLDAQASALAGILAWYSLIHTGPDLLGRTFAEFARTIRPGGGLCIGFFAGPTLMPFNHPITTAYSWPIPRLAGLIEQAGFTILSASSRQNPGERAHAVIEARRHSDHD